MIRKVVVLAASVGGLVAACCAAPPKCPEPITIIATVDAGREPTPLRIDDEPAVDATPDGGPERTEPWTEPYDLAGAYGAPDCASACQTLLRLSCPEGRPKPGQDSCYVVCRRAQATAGRIDFKPKCIATSKTRAQLRACGTYRCLP